jgi:asparagine synthase (glutamine-hydrolysing)
MPPRSAAQELLRLLVLEVTNACAARKEIYVLQSGGLDSRIVAGVLAQAERQGNLQCKPTCITWGREDSRDVVYGGRVAKLLGWEWQHIPLSAENVLHNTEVTSMANGGLVSPCNYHAMPWFERVDSEALVLAGSYGDSIGRGEFSNRHLLELQPLRLTNRFDLLHPEVYAAARTGFDADLLGLSQRLGNEPAYARYEAEQLGVYMRNMIAQAMNEVNRHATLYQMFTAPAVYEFIWSLHPSLRTDDIYAALLEMLGPDLSQLPWARTNRALRGKTIGADPRATLRYHDYWKWIATEGHDHFAEKFDPDWFAHTGLFDGKSCRKLDEQVVEMRRSPSAQGAIAADKWLWMVSLRHLVDHLGDRVRFEDAPSGSAPRTASATKAHAPRAHSPLKERIEDLASKLPLTRRLHALIKEANKIVRRWRLRKAALRRWPPVR